MYSYSAQLAGKIAPDLLARVSEVLRQSPEIDALFGRAVDPASGEGSVIKSVHAVTGRYDIIAFVESPDLKSLGN